MTTPAGSSLVRGLVVIGIDDTDIIGSPGTNQLARAIAADFSARARLLRITRHQLLDDPRVPYTSQNGSASILLQLTAPLALESIVEDCRDRMRSWYVDGSDPGLCVATRIPDEVVQWGQRCQYALVTQALAHDVAQRCNIHLEGLGGTNGGIIGALAAVGLCETANDGRIVMWQSWPDNLTGATTIDEIRSRDIDVVILSSGAQLKSGVVDVGKHLRPNMVHGRATLWVERSMDSDIEWRAIKRR